MKAITTLEPWASLIACGAKQIETRGWATKYRGPIAIHAGKNKKYAIGVITEFNGITLPDDFSLNYGNVIAIADLVDCVLMDALNISTGGKVNGIWLANGDYIEGNELLFGDFQPGRYAWILNNVQQIEPVPEKGQQRIWEWDKQ